MSIVRRSGNLRAENKRRTSMRQRKQQHLLDVKVRSRKAAQQRTRKIIRFLCSAFLLTALIGGACYGTREGMRRLIWQNPEYILSQLDVTTDGALARDQILDAAGVREGCNIFSVNLAKIRERLSILPQIEHVEILRTLPNRISINLIERKPVAWLALKEDEDPSSSADSYLIDAGGTLIRTKLLLPEYFHLPVIYGYPTRNLHAGEVVDDYRIIAALELIRLSAASPIQVRFQVRGIDLARGYCMVVTDQAKARIVFGFDRLDWQLDRLAMVLDRIDESKKELQTVNLMVVRNVPMTFAGDPPPPPDTPSAAAAQKSKPAAVAKASPAAAARKPRPALPVRRAEAAPAVTESFFNSNTKPRGSAPAPVKRATPADPQQESNKTNGQG